MKDILYGLGGFDSRHPSDNVLVLVDHDEDLVTSYNPDGTVESTRPRNAEEVQREVDAEEAEADRGFLVAFKAGNGPPNGADILRALVIAGR